MKATPLRIAVAAIALFLAGACSHCVAAGGVELDETEPQSCAVFVGTVDVTLDELAGVALPGFTRANLELKLDGWRVKVDPNPDHQGAGYWESQRSSAGACSWFHTFGQTWCEGHRLIVVADPDWPDGVLSHELVHAVLFCASSGIDPHSGWKESGLNDAISRAAKRARELEQNGGSL